MMLGWSAATNCEHASSVTMIQADRLQQRQSRAVIVGTISKLTTVVEGLGEHPRDYQ
jgi:hypothetical protein